MTLPTRIIREDDHLEAIRRYYGDRSGLSVLPDHYEVIRQRLLRIWTLKVEGWGPSEIAKLIEEETGICSRQVRRDIHSATTLFGDLDKTEREAEREALYALTLRMVRKAEARDDYDAAAKLIAQLVKIRRFDRDEPNMPDFERLQPGLVAQVLDEVTRQYLAKLHGTDASTPGVINLNNLDMQDAEWEEATNPDAE